MILVLLIRLNPFHQYYDAYLSMCLHVHMLAHEEYTSRSVLVGKNFCFCNKIMGVKFFLIKALVSFRYAYDFSW